MRIEILLVITLVFLVLLFAVIKIMKISNKKKSEKVVPVQRGLDIEDLHQSISEKRKMKAEKFKEDLHNSNLFSDDIEELEEDTEEVSKLEKRDSSTNTKANAPVNFAKFSLTTLFKVFSDSNPEVVDLVFDGDAGKKFKEEILRNNERGIIRSCHPIEFLNSKVIADIREGDQRNITIRLKLIVIDYIVSQKSGALLAGSKDDPIEVSYDVEIVRRVDKKGKETPFKLEAINICLSE